MFYRGGRPAAEDLSRDVAIEERREEEAGLSVGPAGEGSGRSRKGSAEAVEGRGRKGSEKAVECEGKAVRRRWKVNERQRTGRRLRKDSDRDGAVACQGKAVKVKERQWKGNDRSRKGSGKAVECQGKAARKQWKAQERHQPNSAAIPMGGGTFKSCMPPPGDARAGGKPRLKGPCREQCVSCYRMVAPPRSRTVDYAISTFWLEGGQSPRPTARRGGRAA